MTFPKYRKNEDLINRSNFVFRCLFAFYLDREKCVFSKIAFQVPSKVHFVRLIFRSQGKFTLLILEPVQIFFSVFSARENRLKKISQRLGPRPSQQASRPGPSRPQPRAAQRQAQAGARRGRRLSARWPSPNRTQAGQPPFFPLFCFPFSSLFLAPYPK